MTKAEERKILEQVRNLISGTELVKKAFEGVLELAEENISCDFWLSFPDKLEYERSMLEQTEKDFSEYRASTEKVLDDMTEELTMWKNKHTDSVEHYEKIIAENNGKIAELRRDIAGCEDCNKELREQIIRLKAEIYDLERA